ncbi:MAG: hypothetical protein J0L66_10655 [Cytophagales bacterium]|nr:hypothetical protein [Cytophagales bacterium]
MKKLSFEKMEKIEGGCIEYALAWAEATYNYLEAETEAARAFWGAVATANQIAWLNCAIE